MDTYQSLWKLYKSNPDLLSSNQKKYFDLMSGNYPIHRTDLGDPSQEYDTLNPNDSDYRAQQKAKNFQNPGTDSGLSRAVSADPNFVGPMLPPSRGIQQGQIQGHFWSGQRDPFSQSQAQAGPTPQAHPFSNNPRLDPPQAHPFGQSQNQPPSSAGPEKFGGQDQDHPAVSYVKQKLFNFFFGQNQPPSSAGQSPRPTFPNSGPGQIPLHGGPPIPNDPPWSTVNSNNPQLDQFQNELDNVVNGRDGTKFGGKSVKKKSTAYGMTDGSQTNTDPSQDPAFNQGLMSALMGTPLSQLGQQAMPYKKLVGGK